MKKNYILLMYYVSQIYEKKKKKMFHPISFNEK